MAGEYEKAITIQEAIDAINNRDYLLPAIQRKFVWSSYQICVLFDSLMREYPINTFMFWEIKDREIKKNYKFYEFIKYYCQRFNEENPHVLTNASFKDFVAIIDGQQRLTSLYIGLCSTYAYKQPRVWWPSTKDDNILPPRKLYLDLKEPNKTEEETLMSYNFRFLTDEQFETSKTSPNNPYHWFCLHDVLNLPKRESPDDILLDVVLPELDKLGLVKNEFARKSLLKIYTAIRTQKVIHYFKETNQQIDHVLDVFIRTNSGGTKLEFADLLMSIAVAHWEGDFRQEVDNLTKYIHQRIDLGFYIERDWILKACLMLTDADVKFKVMNFSSEQVKLIQSQWETIKECIKATFLLIHRFGINPQSLTSKNAVIPICYYLYKHQVGKQPLYCIINNPTKTDDHRTKISQWFYMALLKGVFGGQADTILTSMREVLRADIEKDEFPLTEIIERYKATNKDLRFDADYIESMLDIQHGEGRCRALLHLLFPEMDPSRIYHIDHLHPKSEFENKRLKEHPFLNQDNQLMEFYTNPEHWNSVANLHLLDDSINQSKKARRLDDWIDDPSLNLSKSSMLLEGVDLAFEDFREFYAKRRDKLKERLSSRVFISKSAVNDKLSDEADEQVVDEPIL